VLALATLSGLIVRRTGVALMIRIASQENRTTNIVCKTVSRDELADGLSALGAGAVPAFVERRMVISRYRG